MLIKEVLAEMDRLAAMMVEKGIPKPKADMWVENGDRLQLNLWGQGMGDSGLKSFFADCPREAIVDAKAHIAALPSTADRNLQAFHKKVADAIDFGNEHGIEGKWLNPLIETSRALAENAITDGR